MCSRREVLDSCGPAQVRASQVVRRSPPPRRARRLMGHRSAGERRQSVNDIPSEPEPQTHAGDAIGASRPSSLVEQPALEREVAAPRRGCRILAIIAGCVLLLFVLGIAVILFLGKRAMDDDFGPAGADQVAVKIKSCGTNGQEKVITYTISNFTNRRRDFDVYFAARADGHVLNQSDFYIPVQPGERDKEVTSYLYGKGADALPAEFSCTVVKIYRAG